MTENKNAVTLGSLKVGQTHQRLGAKRIICNIRFSKVNKVIPERILYFDHSGNFRSVTAQTFVKWSMGRETSDPLEMPPDETLKSHVNGGVTRVRSDRRKKTTFGPQPRTKPVSQKPEGTKSKMKDSSLLAFAAKKMGGINSLKREFAISRIEELNGSDLTVQEVLDTATDEDWYDYLVECRFSDFVNKVGKLTPEVIQQRIVDLVVDTERGASFISAETGIKITTVRASLKKLVKSGRLKMTGKGMKTKYTVA